MFLHLFRRGVYGAILAVETLRVIICDDFRVSKECLYKLSQLVHGHILYLLNKSPFAAFLRSDYPDPTLRL